MSAPETMWVQIAGAKVRVPVLEDAETTQRVADAVTERLRQIEEASERIDTYGFALRAAFEFAAEAERERLDNARAQTQVALQLENLAAALAKAAGREA